MEMGPQVECQVAAGELLLKVMVNSWMGKKGTSGFRVLGTTHMFLEDFLTLVFCSLLFGYLRTAELEKLPWKEASLHPTHKAHD